MNCTKCIVRSLRANSRAPSDHGSIYGSGELLLDARDHDVARRLQDDHEEEGEGCLQYGFLPPPRPLASGFENEACCPSQPQEDANGKLARSWSEA